MGWRSGAQIAEEVWSVVKKHLPKGKVRKVAKDIADIFENHDCDCLQEREQLWEDSGLRQYYQRKQQEQDSILQDMGR